MKSKVKFYSAKEESTIQEEIKAGLSSTKIARKYAKAWGRTEGSLQVKVCKIMREGVSTTKKKIGRPIGSKTKKAANIQTPEKGVTLRNGFVFDFKPQRAEMFQDHVRIYF